MRSEDVPLRSVLVFARNSYYFTGGNPLRFQYTFASEALAVRPGQARYTFRTLGEFYTFNTRPLNVANQPVGDNETGHRDTFIPGSNRRKPARFRAPAPDFAFLTRLPPATGFYSALNLCGMDHFAYSKVTTEPSDTD